MSRKARRKDRQERSEGKTGRKDQKERPAGKIRRKGRTQDMKRHLQNITLFQKFAVTIILLGLMPMLILTFFISNKMIRDYRSALEIQYEHAAFYMGSSIETMLSSYNTISQMPYSYNDEPVRGDFRKYDNLRQIIHGDHYTEEELESERKSEMTSFLRYVEGADRDVIAAHFIGEDAKGAPVDFHYSTYSAYFKGEELFETETGCGGIDKSSNQLILIPKHGTPYFGNLDEQVFTVARNYFDNRGTIGDVAWVGTLLLDVRIKRLEQIFRSVKYSGAEEIYIVKDRGECFFSSLNEKIGMNIRDYLKKAGRQEERLVLSASENKYGLSVVVVMDTGTAFSSLRTQQRLMYLILAVSILALIICSVFFSRKLVDPIRDMMEQMKQVETGNFDIRLPVRRSDEIGILSARFNQMSETLKKYIDQYYGAQIRQKEAELTALRSQIYPHFLYNTLEIIRMTAMENSDNKVSEMIEALSVQIHYLIGTAQDMVPLREEIRIVKKYIYLLNCRIEGRVWLSASMEGLQDILVPKLILQPIVENAYVHGLKPKNGNGRISIEVQLSGDDMELSVMDNGIGMDQQELKKIGELLNGNDPGIKNEYNWQSVGMKNIHDRLRYLYGEGYGIQVTSHPGVGTIVCARMPVIRGESDDENDNCR